MSDSHERRRFKRIPFDAPTVLTQDDKRWNVELLDISFKGFLIETPDGWKGDRDEEFQAAISLSPDTVVHMKVKLAHEEHHHLGFECQLIDSDSMTHLRQIVERNLGDSTELMREFRKLIEV